MQNWLGQLRRPKPQPIHPPWEVGQYVTYFRQRDDGSWLAFALRIMGQTEEGIWAICGDFKYPVGENRVWLRCDPTASQGLDVRPGHMEIVRGSPGKRDPKDFKYWSDEPVAHAVQAINLLYVQGSQSATKALAGKPRDVNYACGIKQAYPLGIIDLNPRVMVTGVACQTTVDGRDPMVVTSFGINNGGPMVSVYEDFVDFSHMTRVEHEGFEVTYPGTWFLRPAEVKANDPGRRVYVANVGGNTCVAIMAVELHGGTLEHLQEAREKFASQAKARVDKPSKKSILRSAEPLTSKDGTHMLISDYQCRDYQQPQIEGLEWAALYDSGDRLGDLTLFGCIAKQNPRRRETLDEMERVFREIIESFRFT